jgi:two-component sensor histidine kinase
VRFSGRHADNIVQYVHALERRIGAMAKSHSLLTTGGWKGASLLRLIEDELSSHRPPGHASIRLHGENIDLDPKSAMAVGLVFHELATNAVKHGSLTKVDGVVSVDWSKVRRDGHDWLIIDWRETGGPPVTAPTRNGFGRNLLERVFAADVQGRATLEFNAEGVRCVLEIPYARVMIHPDATGPQAPLPSVPASGAPSKPLRNLKVLVVEDGALIALELCETLIGYGAEIVGPCSQLADALDIGAREAIDVALLDVDLNGTKVWPVAELLGERGIPFFFATGFTDANLRPPKFRKSQTINKPYDTDLLLSMMTAIAIGKHAAA